MRAPGLWCQTRRRPTFPPGEPGSNIGPAGLNFRVRDGNGCDPRGMVTEKLKLKRAEGAMRESLAVLPTIREARLGIKAARWNSPPASRVAGLRQVQRSKLSGQAERAISTGQLNALRRLHSPPINQVVFLGPWYPEACAPGLGDLILGRASRLDAFSGYPCLTSLPCDAAGATTGTQEVSPSRSSRTRDSSPQVSSAHTR